MSNSTFIRLPISHEKHHFQQFFARVIGQNLKTGFDTTVNVGACNQAAFIPGLP